MPSQETPRHETWLLGGIFILALVFHFLCVTWHLTVPFMPGHEFRQAQTALISYYIDQQNNFSLLYETPVLGKPWVSLLLEVPFYEWSVVGLSRTTGWPHIVAARAISIGCFYLMLPALWLLLGRFRLSGPRRLFILALVLTCPVYVFYSRAFLMESMELMACAWFLLGFVRTMDERRWGWLLLTIIAGTAAALIKSATLAVWLLPAAGYGVWWLARDLIARRGAKAVLLTMAWGLATVAVPLGALRWWISYTDPIKAAHASAWIFTSHNLSVGNWGLFDLAALFSGEVWRQLLGGWAQAVMPGWLIGLLLVTGLALPRVRWPVLGIGGIFFLAQFLFPFAYAYQDYYFYACAVFLCAGIGYTLFGLLDSCLPRWLVAGVLLVPLIGQGLTYWHGYRQLQAVDSAGGFAFTTVLRELTPANSVIVVGGADWAAITPYYAQRKALMIRNGLEDDPVYLDRAFADLAGENVSAMVLFGPVREHRALIERAAARFGFDASAPTLKHALADVYIAPAYRSGVEFRVQNNHELTMPKSATVAAPSMSGLREISAAEQGSFPNIIPAPFRMQFEFGVDWLERDGQSLLSAHPNSDLWVKPPAGATQIRWGYGIFAGAYEKPGAQTNGVEFIVLGESPAGQSREIYRRLLDPAKNQADQGDQIVTIPYKPLPEEILRFATRPNDNSAYDWAYWIRIEVR